MDLNHDELDELFEYYISYPEESTPFSAIWQSDVPFEFDYDIQVLALEHTILESDSVQAFFEGLASPLEDGHDGMSCLPTSVLFPTVEDFMEAIGSWETSSHVDPQANLVASAFQPSPSSARTCWRSDEVSPEHDSSLSTREQKRSSLSETSTSSKSSASRRARRVTNNDDDDVLCSRPVPDPAPKKKHRNRSSQKECSESSPFFCTLCENKSFTRRSDLNRHMETKHNPRPKRYYCPCGRTRNGFSREDQVDRHQLRDGRCSEHERKMKTYRRRF